MEIDAHRYIMKDLHFYVQTERFSIKSISYVIGTKMLIVHKVNRTMQRIMKSEIIWDPYLI